ncbi:hypothetical protein M3Y95_00521300 [Aphelenchoides besseyi]|nr:hypothetical protein M3Y95_00521300 [Aphelenchoides besseyi]
MEHQCRETVILTDDSIRNDAIRTPSPPRSVPCQFRGSLERLSQHLFHCHGIQEELQLSWAIERAESNGPCPVENGTEDKAQSLTSIRQKSNEISRSMNRFNCSYVVVERNRDDTEHTVSCPFTGSLGDLAQHLYHRHGITNDADSASAIKIAESQTYSVSLVMIENGTEDEAQSLTSGHSCLCSFKFVKNPMKPRVFVMIAI